MYPLLLKKSLLSAIVIQFARSQYIMAPKLPIGAKTNVPWISAEQLAFRARSRSRKRHRCMRISVQVGNLKPSIQFVVPQRDTIDDVKAKAASDNCIAKDLLGEVMFKGKPLKVGSTLSDCKIQSCDLLKIQMTWLSGPDKD